MKRLPIMMISWCQLARRWLRDALVRRARSGSDRHRQDIQSGLPPASGTASAAASPSGQRPTATPTQGPAREIGVQAWFSRNGKLFVTQRTVPATTGVGRAALDRLLTGPSAAENAAGLRSQIPAGTTLRGVRISAGIATADLSSSFESAASPSAMPLRIAQVVYTLTQFPTVTGVRFAINGQGVTVVGGVPVQSPQTRAMYGGYLPAITVQSPVIGAQVSSPGHRVWHGRCVRGDCQRAHPGLGRPRDRQDVHQRELRHRLPRRLLGHDPLLGSADPAWHDRGV